MKKLLVSIANYGDDQLGYLNRVIDEFKSYKEFDVSVTIHSTTNINRSDIKLVMHPISVKFFLVFKHRMEFYEQRDNFDLFLYNENDMLIEEEAIKTYCKYDDSLPIDTCLGFLRYEQRINDNNLYFPDMNPFWGETIKEKDIQIGDSKYFKTQNPHQGCWLLSKAKLKTFLFSDGYFIETNSLETGATGPFLDWGLGGNIKKVHIQDRKDLKNCLIHHLSDKYANKPDAVWQHSPGPLTFEELMVKLNIQ